MSQLLTDDSEVVFEQSEETAEAALNIEQRQRRNGVGRHATSRWDPSKSNGIRPASRGETGSRLERSEG